MNYREPLTKNEIREHAAHYENSNPAVYCNVVLLHCLRQKDAG